MNIGSINGQLDYADTPPEVQSARVRGDKHAQEKVYPAKTVITYTVLNCQLQE